MTTRASRRSRTSRNSMAEALGLGKTYPLRDLPVRAEPPVAAFETMARVLVTDSEPGVAYLLLDQDGKPLAGGAEPKGTGNGEELAIDSPPIEEDIKFTVQASRPSGGTAILFGSAEVRVGLDDSLGIAVVPEGPQPAVIDYGTPVTVEVSNSQEAVFYRLVGRPDGDNAAPDDPAAMAADIPLSDGGDVSGTASAIRLLSKPLSQDQVIHVRAVKDFGGAKPAQTVLLKAPLPVFVRPDSSLAVSAKAPIIDHSGKSAIRIDKAAKGISYQLHSRPIYDSEFLHDEAADPSALVVPADSGDVRIKVPPAPPAWEEAADFTPVGDAADGSGGILTLPVAELVRDTMFIVEARKAHQQGAAAFTSAERLDQVAAVLVRPDPAPPLRLSALIADGKLVQLGVLGGEAGVFYTLIAGSPRAEVYVHQHDWVDQSVNKGIGQLQLKVDFAIGTGPPEVETRLAPPPLPLADLKPVVLPADLEVNARRATTDLASSLGTATIAALPKFEVKPDRVAAGASAKVVIAEPAEGERYFLAIDGKPAGDPVAGQGDPLSFDTGPLAPGQVVELRVAPPEKNKSIEVERRTVLAIAIG